MIIEADTQDRTAKISVFMRNGEQYLNRSMPSTFSSPDGWIMFWNTNNTKLIYVHREDIRTMEITIDSIEGIAE